MLEDLFLVIVLVVLVVLVVIFFARMLQSLMYYEYMCRRVIPRVITIRSWLYVSRYRLYK